MSGHLGINVDIASTVFRKGSISVIDYLFELLGCRNIQDLERLPRLHLRIKEVLKGVSVVTTHRGDQKVRFKVAIVNEETPNSKRFEDRDSGKEMSISDYFKSQYNISLKYPNLPLAFKANGKTAFPLECLMIAPAQRFMKRLSPQQTSDMIKATTQRPDDRLRAINDACETTLKFKENPYMKSFGLEVKDKMVR